MPKSTKTTQPTTTTNRTRKPRTIPATLTASTPNHNDIAHRAYELFLSNGAMHGRDLEHWLQAESELLRDRSGTAGN
jgi:hypothetical protein